MAPPGGARQAPSVAPDYGSFPLDRRGACTALMQGLMACLKREGGVHANCKHLSREYLACRMAKQLMAPEDLDGLGFHAADIAAAKDFVPYTKKKEREGYIAGTGEVAAMRGGRKPERAS